jgi:hypothetical protein
MTEPNRLDWASVKSLMESGLLWTRRAPLPGERDIAIAGRAATANLYLAAVSDTDPPMVAKLSQNGIPL